MKNIMELGGKTALTVEGENGTLEVFVNGKTIGSTPLKATNIKPGETKITLRGSTGQYDTSMEFLPRSEVYLKRDLGVSQVFSSGQNSWVEKNNSGTVATVISEPSNAAVFINNDNMGNTPFSSNTLSEDSYDVRVEAPGYEAQSIRIKVIKGYTVNLAVKLFPVPVPQRISKFEGSDSLYNGILDNDMVTTDTNVWVKGVVYWNKTRGINLENLGVNKDPVFDYYLDYKGYLYDKNGDIITGLTDMQKLKDLKAGLYLGKTSEGESISSAAKATLQLFSGISTAKMATIRQTPTGWLRVRSTAGLNGTEIARVDVGAKYEILEEAQGWVKIKVSDTVSGWVSAEYVTK